jgi:uncharacterized membrane protein
VVVVPLTTDEAFKLIMSAGVIQPRAQAKLTELAEAAKRERVLASTGK